MNKNLQDAFIVDGIRTPIGTLKGGLSEVRTDDLAALVLKTLMDRNPQIDPLEIGDVFMGCANQAGEDNRNVARMASLLAGIPYQVPAETLNRLCASGMSANISAARNIQFGDADLSIGSGVEGMTRAPLVLEKSSHAFSGQVQLYDSSFGWRFVNPKMKEMYGVDSMGITAENLAEKYSITRQEQDEFALWSQEKAAKAQKSGRFSQEIVSISIINKKNKAEKVVSQDEFIKPDTTMEALSKLKPAFKANGTVTAGNSSGLNDGASAVLWASSSAIRKYSLQPLAKLVSSAVVGVEPHIMGIGPVEASKKALEKAGLTLDDIDVLELNEAFSAQTLACLKELGVSYQDPRVNPNGGAIALGHPLGMSGSRILYSAALELKLTGKKYALVTMCVGLGQGYAVILERADDVL